MTLTPGTRVSPARAPLIEVFDSIQGEGRFVGVPMVFVRVATCPIRCGYCDTTHSYAATPTFEVRTDGSGVTRLEPNPVDAARALELVREVTAPRRGELRGAPADDAARGPSLDATLPDLPVRVSLTGGEPLVVPQFCAEFGRLLRAAGGKLHLETAALDPDALATALPAIEHLSADYKLPETLLDRADHRTAHVECIRRASAFGALSIDVKIVITPAVRATSYARALDDLEPFCGSIVLVLQPVTPCGDVTEPVAPTTLADQARAALRRGFDVRVIPQTHKTIGVD